MEEHKKLRETIMQAVRDTIKGPEAAVMEQAEKIADAVMNEVYENFRCLTEIHEIVDTVKAGGHVQIAYAEPEDFEDPYIVRACW